MNVVDAITRFLSMIGVQNTRYTSVDSTSMDQTTMTPQDTATPTVDVTSTSENTTPTDDEPLNLGNAGIDEPLENPDVVAGDFSIDPDSSTQTNTETPEPTTEPETLG